MSLFDNYTTKESSKIVEDFMNQITKDIDDRMSACEKDSDQYKKCENEKTMLTALITSTRISGIESIVYMGMLKEATDLLSKIISFLNKSEYKDSPLIMRAMIDTIAIVSKIPEAQNLVAKDKKEFMKSLEHIAKQSNQKIEEKSNLIDITSIIQQMKSNKP